MNYFFPSFLSIEDANVQGQKLAFTVNSGENAIRLLLRSFNLPLKSKIAIPLFVCDSLKRAVLEEGFEPFYLELKSDSTFWADYNSEKISSDNVAAVILVHLYGFLHPDTEEIMNLCKNKSLPLIHDAAQSFGINEKLLHYNSGVVYSFGAGKSTTAAGGAIVTGLTEAFYLKNTSTVSDLSLQTIHSKLFFKSRIYGYQFTALDKLRQAFYSRVKESKNIKMMSPFQQNMASVALKLFEKKNEVRFKNYECVKQSVLKNDKLELAYPSIEGSFFKIIILVKDNPKEFKNYLSSNNIPFFCLFDSFQIDKKRIQENASFCNTASRIIEISSEASIPAEEIKRIADLIGKY